MSQDLLWLALSWLAYFAIHSLLAGLSLKDWLARRHPGLMPYYRLGYNVLAILLLAGPLYLTFQPEAAPLWQWVAPWRWLGDGLAIAAMVGFVYSLMFYDGAVFLGLRQWRTRSSQVEEVGDLRISPLHRYVRHPWYSLALVVMWTRDMDVLLLLSCGLISLYFALGSRLEERKLETIYGDVYRDYCREVPGLLPRPWRRLTAQQAAELEQRGRQSIGEMQKDAPRGGG